MKRFNMSVAKIKNAKGEYESIPALRDRSGYEAAKANGYAGTEEEWINDIFSDGWVAAVQELDKNKATNADLDKVKADIEGINEILSTSIPPWNLNENIGNICNSTSLSVSVGSTGSSGRYPGHQIKGKAIPMIHTGKIRIKCSEILIHNPSSQLTTYYVRQNTYAKIYLNTTPVYELYFEGSYDREQNLSLDVDVVKGDVLSIVVSAECTATPSTIEVESSISEVKLYANIETPFVYQDLRMFDPTRDDFVENPSTTETLDTLMSATS